MALITLLSEPQAKVGGEFYFMGPLTDCKDCRLKGVCFNLEPGSRYRVVEVRSQRHACEECEGEVVAVEVEKVSTPGAVPNFWRCHAVGKREGQKYTVTKLGKDLECPIGEKMVAADLL